MTTLTLGLAMSVRSMVTLDATDPLDAEGLGALIARARALAVETGGTFARPVIAMADGAADEPMDAEHLAAFLDLAGALADQALAAH